MADNEYKPEEEGSLDEFEKELIEKEKKKSQRNIIISVVLLVVLAGAGYYLYSSVFSAPPPPPPPAAVPMPVPAPPPAPAPEEAAPVSEHAAAPAAPAKKEEPVKAAPSKDAAKAAKPAKAEAKKEEPVKKAAVKAETKPESPAERKAPEAAGMYTLQLGVFLEKANAQKLMAQVEKLGFTAETLEKPINVKSIGIYTGYYRYRELAVDGAAKLSADGFTNKVVLKGPGNYTVEVGTAQTDKAADAIVKQLEAKGYKVDVDYTSVKKQAIVVLLRNIESADRLNEIGAVLKENKVDYLVIKKK